MVRLKVSNDWALSILIFVPPLNVLVTLQDIIILHV
jgi:hypothetical protein